MISFIQLFLQTLIASLGGVALAAIALYVFWNCMTAKKVEEAPMTFYTCPSSFSLIRPLVTRATGR